MKNFKKLERDGWLLSCPLCGEDIFYSIINIQQIPLPFFYAEEGNDVLLRKEDERRLERILNEDRKVVESDVLEKLWMRILKDAPEAPCGGKYGLWSNVKCPTCFHELPYNNGVRNVSLRLNEPKIVLIDGATIVGDSDEDSWQVKVNIRPNS